MRRPTEDTHMRKRTRGKKKPISCPLHDVNGRVNFTYPKYVAQLEMQAEFPKYMLTKVSPTKHIN
jgi:hypothetical protein